MDETLTCVVWGTDFIHSESEQAFFKKLGFTGKPKRCPECRPRKDSKPDRVESNGRVTTRISCSSCGTSTTVPFEPIPGKPLYCKPCFEFKKKFQGKR